MSEESEAAWAKFWDSDEPDYEGIEGGFDGGWRAALAWAIGKVETEKCVCRSLLLSARRARYTCEYNGEYRYEGDDFVVIRHDSRCPCALAASLREALP